MKWSIVPGDTWIECYLVRFRAFLQQEYTFLFVCVCMWIKSVRVESDSGDAEK